MPTYQQLLLQVVVQQLPLLADGAVIETLNHGHCGRRSKY